MAAWMMMGGSGSRLAERISQSLLSARETAAPIPTESVVYSFKITQSAHSQSPRTRTCLEAQPYGKKQVQQSHTEVLADAHPVPFCNELWSREA